MSSYTDPFQLKITSPTEIEQDTQLTTIKLALNWLYLAWHNMSHNKEILNFITM